MLGHHLLAHRFDLTFTGRLDVVQNVGCVVHGGIDATGTQFQVSVVDVGELTQVAGFQIGLGIVGCRGAAFHGQGFAGDIRFTLDRIVIAFDHQQKAAVVVAIGEVDGLLAFFLDGDPGQRQIDVAGL
ncbi:hypothetical protein D3C73_1204810 [compost metagenome]